MNTTTGKLVLATLLTGFCLGCGRSPQEEQTEETTKETGTTAEKWEPETAPRPAKADPHAGHDHSGHDHSGHNH